MSFLNKNNQLNIKGIEGSLKFRALKANFRQKDADLLVDIVLNDLKKWFENNKNATGQDINKHILGFLKDTNQSPDLVNEWEKSYH